MALSLEEFIHSLDLRTLPRVEGKLGVALESLQGLRDLT